MTATVTAMYLWKFRDSPVVPLNFLRYQEAFVGQLKDYGHFHANVSFQSQVVSQKVLILNSKRE